jgi:predicted nucleotidyltransferase component of viral defense system
VKQSPYFAQVLLLLRILPLVAKEHCFALKGGTAINLFVRDMPRLSVDIDLAYLPGSAREEALAEIGRALREITRRVESQVPGARVLATGKADAPRALVSLPGAQIKIEPNPILRGTVFGQETRDLVPAAQELFETSATVRMVSFADLYAGKLVAALDRQHPRDLFDIKLLLENEGLTDAVRRAFVVYLASHPRPMAELLDPGRQPLQGPFEGDFAGMTRIPITVEELEETLEKLVSLIHRALTPEERRFLLSMKEGNPEWNLPGLPTLEKLPALQWKVRNVLRLMENKTRHRAAVEKLRRTLEL